MMNLKFKQWILAGIVSHEDLDSVCDSYGDDLERNSLLPKQKSLRAQLGTETDFGLNDALVANPSSSPVDYFSDVFNLVKFNTFCCRDLTRMLWVSARPLLLEGSRPVFSNNYVVAKKDWITAWFSMNMADIGNQFVSTSNDRQNRFGKLYVN